MIKTEELTIGTKSFTRTWSSRKRYVVRENISYTEAYDLTELHREYKEGEPIPEEDNG